MTVLAQEVIALDLPHMRFFPSYLVALREGFRRGVQPEKTKEEIADIEADPEQHLFDLNAPPTNPITMPDGTISHKVPYECLWLTEGDDFIGEVHFRHELNPVLENYGGHIGYGVRPSLWGHGYATWGVELVKIRARNMGLKRLLITCSPDNPASERVILKAGGVYENTVIKPFGHDRDTKRFWVALQEDNDRKQG